MSLDIFSPARAPKLRPEYDVDPFEFPACRSVLYAGNDSEPGPRSCRVSHAETGETAHGCFVGTAWSSWTDAEAAESRALLVEAFGGWECLNCGRPCYRQGRRGCCSTACEMAEHRVDDREDAEAEA